MMAGSISCRWIRVPLCRRRGVCCLSSATRRFAPPTRSSSLSRCWCCSSGTATGKSGQSSSVISSPLQLTTTHKHYLRDVGFCPDSYQHRTTKVWVNVAYTNVRDHWQDLGKKPFRKNWDTSIRTDYAWSCLENPSQRCRSFQDTWSRWTADSE